MKFIGYDMLSYFYIFLSLLGYEGLEVINPEGGTEDAEAEAQRGRWRQEVLSSFYSYPKTMYL